MLSENPPPDRDLSDPPLNDSSSNARGWWLRACEPGSLAWDRALFAILVLTVVLFNLRTLVPRGADALHIARICGQPGSWPFYYRSFLTCFIHHFVWVLSSPFDFSGWDAVALSSALAGSLAVLALWRLCRHPLFLAVNICAGSFLVHVGHVETYAWVGAGFLWTMVAVREVLLGRASTAFLMNVYCLSFAMHMLMLFYFPVVALALVRGRPGTRLALLTPVFLLGASVIGFPLIVDSTGATELGLNRFIPWFEPFAKNQFCTLFSEEHRSMLWLFACSADLPVKAPLWLLSSFGVPGWEGAFITRIPESVGLPIDRLGLPVSFLLLAVFARRIQGLFLNLLLLSVGIGVTWSIFWNPDWGFMDWDLFSQYALPLHLLVGLLILPDRSAYIIDADRRERR